MRYLKRKTDKNLIENARNGPDIYNLNCLEKCQIEEGDTQVNCMRN